MNPNIEFSHPSGRGEENSECRRNKICQHLPDSLFKEGHCCEEKLFCFAKSNLKSSPLRRGVRGDVLQEKLRGRK